MDIHQLPDLSGWRYVEVWTLEEAAMLWAAIDPMEHFGKRLVELELKADLHPAQHKKALLFLRAATEAVCAGTLPFAEAWEIDEDHYHGSYKRKVDFPELPEPLKIAPHLTRIGQAAFLKWANSKKIPSYRQSIMQNSKAPLTAIPPVEHPTVQPVPLLLPMPAFLDPSNPLSPVEMRAAADVWEIVVSSGAHERAKSVKDAMRVALDEHPEHSILSNEAKRRIATVANWNKDGGATKTPTRATPHPIDE